MLGALAALGAYWVWRRAEVAPARVRTAALGARPSRVPAAVDRALAPYVAAVAPGRPVGWALGWWAILGGLALLVGWLVGPAGLLLAFVATIAAGPVAYLAARRHHAAARRAALPEFAHGVARSLRAGESLAVALTTGPVPAPLVPEIDAVRARVALGASTVDALSAWADGSGDDATRALAGAFAVVHLEGGAAAAPLEGLADALAAREAVVREATALATQARLSAVVILLAPVAFVLVGGVAAPDQFARLTGSWMGRVCLLGGLGLDAVGGWWMQCIVGGVA